MIDEKKFKKISIILGTVFIIIVISTFIYINNIKNQRNNEKISDVNTDEIFKNEKNKDSVLRMIENSNEKVDNIKNENLKIDEVNNEKELLSKKILMSKPEDRNELRLNYIKNKITNYEIIDYYIKYKRSNLNIDFSDKDIFNNYFNKKEQNNLILVSYENDFKSSLNNIISNFDVLDTHLKAKLQQYNNEKNIKNEDIFNKYNLINEELQKEQNVSIDDLKIKLMISRDNYNDEKNKNINFYTDKENLLKNQLDFLLKIYTKVITLEKNNENILFLSELNKLLFNLNDEQTFEYDMNYIKPLLENLYKDDKDLGFKNFVNLYLEEFVKPKNVSKKDKIEADLLNINLNKDFISKTNKKYSYEDLTEEEVKNIFIKLP